MSGIKFTTGTVSAVNEKTVRVHIRLPEVDNLRTAWLEILQRNTQNNKDYWLPDIGEQVKLLLDDPYGDNGVVLGAVYSQIDRRLHHATNCGSILSMASLSSMTAKPMQWQSAAASKP